MANRAFLCAASQKDFAVRPDTAWPEVEYYDSQHNIPLSWFFFFTPGDVTRVQEQWEEQAWYEVKLAARKKDALEIFSARRSLLNSVVGHRIQPRQIDGFWQRLRGFEGDYLLMAPEQVLDGGLPGTDDEHAARFIRLLELLDSGGPREGILAEARFFVGDLDRDGQDSVTQIIGCTYLRSAIHHMSVIRYYRDQRPWESEEVPSPSWPDVEAAIRLTF